MKLWWQYAIFIFLSSFVTTLLMHVYLYQNYGKTKTAVKVSRMQLDTYSTFNLMTNGDREKYHLQSRKPSICQHKSKLKGMLQVNVSHQPNENEVLETVRYVSGGCYQPVDCVSLQRVAVVIPFKNRYQHLLKLVNHIHPIMQRQKIMYCIFVAEQFDDGSFNKARIMNAAYKEITNNWNLHESVKPFDCFIFHDVDMLLENDLNLYLCDKMPKHLSPAIDKFNYTKGYGTQYGGVTAIRTDQYKLVNGHSNRFWGWGGEDNDMEMRINKTGLRIVTVNETYGKYKMIPHNHPWWFSPITGIGSSYRPQKPSSNEKGSVTDNSGLSNFQYILHATYKHKLWTKLILDIRSFELENITLHFSQPNVSDVSVFSLSTLNTNNKTSMGPSFNTGQLEETGYLCKPVYHKFNNMTINRTTSMDDLRYTKVYHNLKDAQLMCTSLQTSCHGIVEQVKERYTLRRTAFVQENTLHYKYGLSEQYDVMEKHYSTAAYVKVCPGDPRYLQFFLNPIFINGNAEKGPLTHFHVDFYIRLFQKTNATFTYQSQLMTSHRAIMEEKIKMKMLYRPWWDSMSKIQFAKTRLVTLSKKSEVFQVERTSSSMLLKVRLPESVLRQPGCYVVKSSLIDESSNNAILEWNWWFKMKARTQGIENKFLEKALARSMYEGKEFRKMMIEKKDVIENWIKQKKKI